MEPALPIPPSLSTRRLLRLSAAVALLALLSTNPQAHGQTSSASSSPYTFHVYKDLVQVPTLVLNARHASYPDLKPADFKVRLDGGPPFHPSQARLEGEDPLSVALFLDLSDPASAGVAKSLSEALKHAPDWLSARDNIAVYAANCSLTQSLRTSPYKPETLRTAATVALISNRPNGSNPGHPPCASNRLWDTLAEVIRQTSTTPGHRVLIAITDGIDEDSRMTWNQLQLFAGQFNVTLIGLRSTVDILWDDEPILADAPVHTPEEEIFSLVCADTGGTVLPVNARTLGVQLQRAVTLLRDRYILEFTRPATSTNGLHGIEIKIPDPRASIRPAGIVFPTKANTQPADPTIIPTNSSRDPVVGDPRIQAQPQ